MGSKKLLIAGGVVAAVAATALLVPALAFGLPISAVLPGGTPAVVAQGDDTPGDGEGKAWGHHKDSPDFPGQGHGWGLHKDSPAFPGQGNGLDKNSPGFPGQGNGLEKDKGNGKDTGDSSDDDSNEPTPRHGNGNAFGHDKDGNPHADDD
ncbi:hypothetical protein SAMN04487846_1601 [Microbacterium sp. cf046]|uniref:hypothetical protein n=1 Tax=Microbacterium sp. cf046 TaxID=1761803 RepID=UPI0008E7ACAB|nr:hypothetical protein [Microbacterium sp. cf046]SFS02725.1 hypothetical protein SAMN04487846_1601 [Microbacterium sp. cf046]